MLTPGIFSKWLIKHQFLTVVVDVTLLSFSPNSTHSNTKLEHVKTKHQKKKQLSLYLSQLNFSHFLSFSLPPSLSLSVFQHLFFVLDRNFDDACNYSELYLKFSLFLTSIFVYILLFFLPLDVLNMWNNF